MKKPKITHKGIVEGCDARTSDDYKAKILLRETKLFWITQYFVKYRKTTSRSLSPWPLYRLNLDSIKKL